MKKIILLIFSVLLTFNVFSQNKYQTIEKIINNREYLIVSNKELSFYKDESFKREVLTKFFPESLKHYRIISNEQIKILNGNIIKEKV